MESIVDKVKTRSCCYTHAKYPEDSQINTGTTASNLRKYRPEEGCYRHKPRRRIQQPLVLYVNALLLLSLLMVTLWGCTTAASEPPSIVQRHTASVAQLRNPPPPIHQTQPPLVEIDTGGHRSKIWDLIFTRDGANLVSISSDKTIRVWEVATGKLVRTLRGQIGAGFEGMIFAAALSLNNRLLAVGGYSKNNNLRLLDFKTGEVIRLLEGHRDVINDLAFSLDGMRLISGSADDTARIWDVGSGQTLHILKGHSDNINAVAFSPGGKRAVTGSRDRTLKLWNVQDGTLIQTMEDHTKEVNTTVFTPDGRYILSGSNDRTIRLWDARTGAFVKVLAKPETQVYGLSMSPDGTRVVTGHGERPYTNNVFAFPSGKRLTRFTEHDNSVGATAVSPDGITVASGGGDDNEIYLWDIDTGRVKQKLVGQGQSIWSVGFAQDGRSIAWGKTFNQEGYHMYQLYGPLEQAFRLQVAGGGFDLDLGDVLTHDTGYERAVESLGRITVRTLDGKMHPTLQIRTADGVIHTITRDSTTGYSHRSFTLTPDGRRVISGGDNGYLAAYDTGSGEFLHEFIGHTSDVWAVAVSPDGRYLVSGADDQTVRLWEVASGTLLLTVFQGTDGEWVAWTPDGFYTASPGGARYVGYHINRGEDAAADYVGLDQIGDLFYRPDLVAKRVEGGFDAEIEAELKRIGSIDKVLASGLPPTITLHTDTVLQTNSRDFAFDYSLEDRGGGIGRIEYRINGVLVASTEGVRSEDFITRHRTGKIRKRLTGNDGRNTVTITVYNKANIIAGKPTYITIDVDDPLKEAPSLYILAIGISAYRDQALQLRYAHSDALEMAKALERHGRGLFKDIQTVTLQNEAATTAGITAAFARLAKKVKPSDVFVWYMAGHGMSDQGNYYFIPWEAEFENRKMLLAASLSHKDIVALLQQIKALKSLLVLDTCYAGLVARTRGMEEKTAIDRLMRATGSATLAATTGKQQALEGYEGYGVFTYALLRGLKGEADRPGYGQGAIGIDELGDYVRDQVPQITLQKWGFRQIPMRYLEGDPFDIGCADQYAQPGCHQSPR